MAIVKKPKVGQVKVPNETAVEAFIAGAEKLSAPPERSRRKQTTMRLDSELLSRVDAAAKRRGVSRSAWVSYALSRALDEEV